MTGPDYEDTLEEGRMGHPKFEVYTQSGPTLGQESAALSWRWRLVAGNGEIVASGESHTSRADAIRALRRVAELASEADVVTVTA